MTSHSRSYGEELQRSIFVQIASAIGDLESAIGIIPIKLSNPVMSMASWTKRQGEVTSHSRSYGEELQRSIFVQIASAIGDLESAIGIIAQLIANKGLTTPACIIFKHYKKLYLAIGAHTDKQLYIVYSQQISCVKTKIFLPENLNTEQTQTFLKSFNKIADEAFKVAPP